MVVQADFHEAAVFAEKLDNVRRLLMLGDAPEVDLVCLELGRCWGDWVIGRVVDSQAVL